MEPKGNVYCVPCKLNGLSLKLIFDTGASNVSISGTEALFMLKNGYLSSADVLGTMKYQTADGSVKEGTRFNIRTIEIGGEALYDVEASVVHNLDAPLLLGQSALRKLGKIQFDYATNVLTVLGNEKVDYRKIGKEEVATILVKEAYHRLAEEINASHILVLVGPNAAPADTLAAYQRIVDLYQQVKSGRDFSQVAREHSDDPSAKENGGNLGYFSALQMVYPFENAAYATPVGQVSKPIRTKFGYHIVKVNATRNSQGEIKIAHLMLRINSSATEADILNIRKKLITITSKLKKVKTGYR